MNIYDISKKAGVSIATVSRVMNKTAYVSEKTQKKVLDAINECGYTPNAFARGLGLGSMSIVGIMCADSSDPYLATGVYYLQQELRNNNYDAILCCTGYDLEAKQKYMKLLLSKKPDAIILVGSTYIESGNVKNQYIREASKEVPILIINGVLDGDNIYCTLCDCRQIVMTATKAMQQSGHSKILYLYNSKSYSGREKLSGYLHAMEENSLASAVKKNKYVHFFDGSVPEVNRYLTSLHKKGLIFDGIITSDDHLAIGAIKYALDNGIRIPDELSIIGYNNSILCEYSTPELTSIDNRLETLCKHSIYTLMGVLHGLNVPLKTFFPAEIIKRETTDF